MKKKRKREQVTCLCKAYRFPHRIDGGKCTGSCWAESYFLLCHEMCEGCVSHRTDGTCDVAGGIESVEYCEGYQDHLCCQPVVRLPVSDIETYYEAKCSCNI